MDDQDARAVALAPLQQRGQVVAVALRRRRRQETGRLVDDDQVFVLVDDGVRRQAPLVVVARRPPWAPGRPRQRAAHHRQDRLAGARRPPGDLDPPPVDEDAADVEQHPRLPPRQPRHPRRQHLIEPAPGVAVADGEGDALWVPAWRANLAPEWGLDLR